MKSNLLRHYCDRYAEPLARQFSERQDTLLTREYPFVLCIPIYDESLQSVTQVLNSVNADVLVIMVFNAPKGLSASPSAQRTQSVLRSLVPSTQQLSIVNWNQQVDILAVDCCTTERQLPPKQGVGLARKIAGDLAVAAIAHHRVASPWIYCTDADAVLPQDYFNRINGDFEGAAAVLFPFTHRPMHRNILQYEISLRYYVLQLEAVGSPYAFQTVGSSMAAHAENYASVRGFPKRSAAEDFYILNKLAKTGVMVRLARRPLTLSSRQSDRVPFGTGAAMNRLRQNPVQRLYHPQLFNCISQWFQQMERLWRDRDRVQALGLEAWWSKSPVAEDILAILIEQGLPRVLQQAYRQCGDRHHFLYYLHVWFDAFRTLRFIHLMRDRGFPSIQISELSQRAPHLEVKDSRLNYLNQHLTTEEYALSLRVGPTQLLAPKS